MSSSASGGEGRVALVTGGASGIGRATAEAFAREGVRLVLADRDEGAGSTAVAELRAEGAQAVFTAVDITDADGARSMVGAAISKFGRLDVAVNCAGVEGGTALTHEYPEGDFDGVVAVNLKGLWLSMKHEIPPMLEQHGGAIVNISSGAATVGVPTMAAYVSSKAGVLGLTRTAALEYARSGVRINAILPGFIRTPMSEKVFSASPEVARQAAEGTPLGRLGQAAEIADCAVYLCSERASFITGAMVPVDGGLRAQ